MKRGEARGRRGDRKEHERRWRKEVGKEKEKV